MSLQGVKQTWYVVLGVFSQSVPGFFISRKDAKAVFPSISLLCVSTSLRETSPPKTIPHYNFLPRQKMLNFPRQYLRMPQFGLKTPARYVRGKYHIGCCE